MQAKKRILSVTIKRMFDDSPDASWLGEYSDKAETEYAIDRAHSEDCDSVRADIQEAKEKLERIADYLESVSLDCNHATWHGDCPDCAEMMDAHDTLTELARDIDECDCSRAGRWSGREYRYFNSASLCSFEKSGMTDRKAWAEEMRKYARQDYERMESLNAGHWCFIGIRAEAEIGLPVLANKGCVHGHEVYYTHTQNITSGGLWSIESDSDKSYLESVEKDELSDLRGQLKALGFSTRAISSAFKSIERKEE